MRTINVDVSTSERAITDKPYASQIVQTVHEQFELIASLYPNHISLVHGDHNITYNELNRQANCIAHQLIALGFSIDMLVGVYFDRSIEMITVILAIIKAGCGYVPLDIKCPKERQLHIISDANISMIITSDELQEDLPDDAITITLNSLLHSAGQELDSPRLINMRSTNLIYANYTSGSSGRPKGVAITHQSVLHLLESPEYVDLSAKTTVLQLAPAAFDAFTFELWGPLLNGGRCVLYHEKLPTLTGLRESIKNNQITTIFLTTALFNLIIDEEPTILNKVSQVLTGGEAHSIKHFRKALRELPYTEIVHVYGPTECTTFATYYKLRDLNDSENIVPIGRPINRTSIYVLDEHLNPASIGELHIGGLGLARGYLNAPELTQEKFINGLLFLDKGQSIYKTGDLVEIRPDGMLIYIKRIDNQVKIHGHRIELGEIETVLNNYYGIKQATVVATGDGVLIRRKLVAYLIPNGQAIEKSSLTNYLRERLPNYMIPSKYIYLDKMPLNYNGKIDRKILQTC